MWFECTIAHAIILCCVTLFRCQINRKFKKWSAQQSQDIVHKVLFLLFYLKMFKIMIIQQWVLLFVAFIIIVIPGTLSSNWHEEIFESGDFSFKDKVSTTVERSGENLTCR
jgi:hypothetical protein